MKQYVIDGLRPEDYDKLKACLDKNFTSGGLDSIYWLELDKTVLTSIQNDHQDCHPHIFALELDHVKLSCEMLVRIKRSIKCDCMAYATSQQREWLMTTIDAILDDLDIDI